MTEPMALIPKPKAADAIRDSVVRILRRTLEEAERGEISFLFMLVANPADEWLPRWSDSERSSAVIGRMEIAKQEMIQDYLNGNK